MNRERRAFKALMDLAIKRPSPISGMEMLTVKHKTGFFADRKARIDVLEAIVAEILQDAPDRVTNWREPSQNPFDRRPRGSWL